MDLGAETVAHRGDGFDVEGGGGVVAQDLTDLPHAVIDGSRRGGEVDAPQGREEGIPGVEFTRMAHEVVQECDRLRSQGELAAAELDTARGSIQDEVAGHEAGRGGQRLPGSPTATLSK